LGGAYKQLGRLKDALECHSESLEIHRKIKYVYGEANQLGSIGLIYHDKGDFQRTLTYLKDSLTLHSKIGYLEGKARSLANIGLVYRDLGQYEQSLKYLKEARSVFQHIGSKKEAEETENQIQEIESGASSAV